MSTAHKTEEEKKEYFDSPEVLEEKIAKLADLIQKSKHFVAFTGAGISTSAGIPDFRSGINTVLPTGPGVWEEQAQGPGKVKKPRVFTPMTAATPTPTHMALVALEQKGLLKYLISQNVDGLHRKSGFPATKLAELHGNSNLETCRTCNRKYLRDFDACSTSNSAREHATGRLCDDPACKQPLYDSIINFGENLPKDELENGFLHSEKADLHLAMGSSLRVTPAAHMPAQTSKRGGKLIIINLQATPLDDLAYMKINGFCDEVIKRVMEKLKVTVPKFTLKRRIGVSKHVAEEGKEGKKEAVLVRGLEMDGSPFTFLRSVSLVNGTKPVTTLKKAPFLLNSGQFGDKTDALKLVLSFQGHYGEPDLEIPVDFSKVLASTERTWDLEYDPSVQTWVKCEEVFPQTYAPVVELSKLDLNEGKSNEKCTIF